MPFVFGQWTPCQYFTTTCFILDLTSLLTLAHIEYFPLHDIARRLYYLLVETTRVIIIRQQQQRQQQQ